MSEVTLKRVVKAYGDNEVIHGIDLEIRRASSSCSSVRRAAASPRCCA